MRSGIVAFSGLKSARAAPTDHRRWPFVDVLFREIFCSWPSFNLIRLKFRMYICIFPANVQHPSSYPTFPYYAIKRLCRKANGTQTCFMGFYGRVTGLCFSNRINSSILFSSPLSQFRYILPNGLMGSLVASDKSTNCTTSAGCRTKFWQRETAILTSKSQKKRSGRADDDQGSGIGKQKAVFLRIRFVFKNPKQESTWKACPNKESTKLFASQVTHEPEHGQPSWWQRFENRTLTSKLRFVTSIKP
jgi:hypothetical protein